MNDAAEQPDAGAQDQAAPVLHGPEALAYLRLKRRRRLGCLRACGIALLVLILVAVLAWWYVSRNLGRLVSELVRQQAGEALNGRLEFDKLDIDLAGRAVMSEAKVYLDGTAEPVISAPRVAVTLNFFSFIGPNRGTRSLAVQLREPQIMLVREGDGGFNLERLVKPLDPNQPRQEIAVALRIQRGKLNFTDLALLSPSYPDFGPQSGLAGDFLAEAGYSATGPDELRPHHEVLDADGTAAYNSLREEAQFDLRLKRAAGGGDLHGKGSLKTDGTRFKMDITLERAGLESFAAYAAHLFPELQLAALEAGAAPQGTANPLLGGQIERLRLQLEQAPQAELVVQANAELKQVLLRSDSLPELALPRAKLAYDTKQQQASADLELDTLGMRIAGKPVLGLSDNSLSGQLRLTGIEVPQVQAKLKQPAIPLSGKLSAVLTLGGTTDAPLLSAELDSEMLQYETLRLGKLSGTAKLDGDELSTPGIKLTGGEVPFTLTGSLNLATQDGKLTASASGIGVQQLADIAARYSEGGTQQKLKADGKVAMKADITLADGKPQLGYRVWSELIRLEGFSLRSPDASGSYSEAGGLKIDALTATLLTAEPLNTPLFTSAEPLRLALRAGGSISGIAAGKPALSITGTADSQNLSPAQVNVSYKLNGPLDDPEIRLQLKGPVEGQPVVLTASGRYRAGWSPITASLTWQATKIDYDGRIDLAGQRIDGKLTAAAVDLRRFSGNPALSGTASVEASLSGSFDKLSVNGQASAPRIYYSTAQKRYEVTDLSAGFALADGDRISVSNGRLTFEGNRLHADGTLGQAGSDLTIASDSFNLLSALAMVPPGPAAPDGQVTKASVKPLSIQSAGPLVLRLTGTLKEPRAELSYQSGPGSVEGHRFTSASVQAVSDLKRATISKFEITSEQGRLSATGSIDYEPQRFNGNVDISNFDVGVITPLLGESPLAELRGLLQGKVKLSGTPKQFAADADIQLTQGSFQGYALDRADAKLVADANGLQISELLITSQNTSLTASGSIPKDAAQSRFTVSAPQVELALLQPLLPAGFPALSGTVKLDVQLRPGRGSLPEADLTLEDTGSGIRVDGRAIHSVDAQAELRSDELNVRQLELGFGGSSLRLSGTARMKDFDPGRKQAFPLNMSLEANNFNLAHLAPLLPEAQRRMLPEGVVTVRPLTLKGTTENPLLTGSISFALSKLPPAVPESVTTIAGNVTLTDNSFNIVNVDIGTSEGTLAGSLGQASITGSGRLALNPPRLLSGSVDIDLSPAASGGRYVKLTQNGLLGEETPTSRSGSFDGTLGGRLSFTAPTAGAADNMAVLGGRLLITEPNATSILTLPTPQQGGSGGGSGTRLDRLQIVVQEGTEIRYRPAVDLRASISGQLTLNGEPGLPPDDMNALSIAGQLTLRRGSLMVYRHTVRLDESYESTIRFSGRPGDFVPSFSGRGVLILPNVLEGGDAVSTGMPGETRPGLPQSGAAAARTSRDLRVFFTFRDVKLTPDNENPPEVTLSSDPPRSPEQILRYLAGGVGDLLTGSGDFSDIAESELIGFGSSWVSRKLEEALGIDALRFGGSPTDESNPFWIDVEQEINPELSVTYFRNFFTGTNQQEEIGLKYRPFRDQLDSRLQGLSFEINLQNDSFRGRGSEFMFTWSTRF